MRKQSKMKFNNIHNLLKVCTLTIIIAVSNNAATQNTWHRITAYGGGERERAVSFVIGERGYICTGLDSANVCRKDLWEYDPGTNSWTQKADFPGVGRRDAIGFAIGNRGYVGTGVSNAIAWMGTKKKDFWEYNPISNAWDQKADWPGNFGGGIYFASSFATSTKGYLVCGKLGFSYYSNELWEYDPVTDDWDEKDEFPGGFRYGGVALAIGSNGYFGCGSDENYYRNDWWEYDPQTDNWTEKAEFPGSPRFNPIGMSIMGRGFVGLGTDGGCQKDFYEYNPMTDSWVQKASFGGSVRRSAVAFAIGNYGYAGTGNGPDGIKRSMYKYKPFFWLDQNTDDLRVASSVFPNPVYSTANVKIEFDGLLQEAVLHVYDLNGKLVSESQSSNTSEVIFNRNELKSGIYLYEIQSVNVDGGIISSSGKIILI